MVPEVFLCFLRLEVVSQGADAVEQKCRILLVDFAFLEDRSAGIDCEAVAHPVIRQADSQPGAECVVVLQDPACVCEGKILVESHICFDQLPASGLGLDLGQGIFRTCAVHHRVFVGVVGEAHDIIGRPLQDVGSEYLQIAAAYLTGYGPVAVFRIVDPGHLVGGEVVFAEALLQGYSRVVFVQRHQQLRVDAEVNGEPFGCVVVVVGFPYGLRRVVEKHVHQRGQAENQEKHDHHHARAGAETDLHESFLDLTVDLSGETFTVGDLFSVVCVSLWFVSFRSLRASAVCAFLWFARLRSL